MVRRIVLIGGGGHCRSVLDAIRRMGCYGEVAVTDPDFQKRTGFLGIEAYPTDDVLPELKRRGFAEAFVCVGSVKNTRIRERLYQMALDIGFCISNVVDPSAVVSEDVRLGRGIFIGKGAIVNAGSHIGDMAIVNTGALVEHGCFIGEFSHIAAGAVLCGDVRTGGHVLIGAGATVIQGVSVGNHAIVGAGSTVLRDVEEGAVAVGIVKG